MKGYMHVIEIILSALILLFALGQFSSLYLNNTPWSNSYLSLISRDIIYTTNILGNDWQNSTFVTYTMSNVLFSNFIEYEFGLKNAIKRNVVVGCFCSSSELSQLTLQLNSFKLNSRNVNFQVLDINNVADWNSLDVIVYGHYQLMSGVEPQILNFLDNDKGIILIGSLTQPQISSDPALHDVFGLQWTNNLITGSSTNDVFTATHPSNQSYYIKKYFYGFRVSNNTISLINENNLQGPISCTNHTQEGLITTRGVAKKFWIIDSSTKTGSGTYCDYVVYVDENNNGHVDPGEGPYAIRNDFILNGYNMNLKNIQPQIYNVKVEAETGSGWGLASAAGLCSGVSDDVCSGDDGLYSNTRNQQAQITINVNRPDTYELWFRSYRGTSPKANSTAYAVSVDGGSEVWIDPFSQRDPNFSPSAPWGWDRLQTASSAIMRLDLGPHTITLRSPASGEDRLWQNAWQNSAVDWIFLRNTTFNAQDSIEATFNRDYKFNDFSQAGPYPDDNNVQRIPIGSENNYVDGPVTIGPVASMIIKQGITQRKNGRAVWIASNFDGEDFKNAIRSAVIWASQKQFTIVSNPSLGGSSTQDYTILEQGDMNNLYQIFVTLWYSRRSD